MIQDRDTSTEPNITRHFHFNGGVQVDKFDGLTAPFKASAETITKSELKGSTSINHLKLTSS